MSISRFIPMYSRLFYVLFSVCLCAPVSFRIGGGIHMQECYYNGEKRNEHNVTTLFQR